jgi:cytoskeletal protein CcmA (bactofilin family)
MSKSIKDEKEDFYGQPYNGPHEGSGNGHGKGYGDNFDQDNVVAFIGHGVEFSGVIKYQGSVRVDGKLDGEVHANGTLYLGEQAVITAKISAQSIISKGQITGDVKAKEKVQLLAPAKMDGSVEAPSLLMEEGVLFNGTCEMSPSKNKGSKYEEPLPLVSLAEALETEPA